MLSNKSLAVVMPAFNAERTLERTHKEAFATAVVDMMFVVDDASTDGTATIAQHLQKTTLLTHARNRGYGAAQKTGYAAALAAGADIVVMVHADYQYPPKLIPALAMPVAEGEAACVLGSRMIENLARSGGMPAWKRAANRLLTFFSNCLLGASLSEYHTGLRAFSAGLLHALPLAANSDDFLFDHQILAQIIWRKEKIAEIPCPARYFPEASIISFPRALCYGFGCVACDASFRAARMGLIKKPHFLTGL